MQIDYTQASTLIDCPQKYYIKFILGLQKASVDTTNIDIRFGQTVHSGLELFYKEKSKEDITKTFDDFIDVEGEESKTKANGIELLNAYIEHYKNKDKDMQILDVETKDSYSIDDITYIVKVDTIIKLNDNIYVLEHKTAKNIAYNYFDKFSPNMQMTGYTEYVRQKYGQCSGILLNVLQSANRKRAYKGEPAGFHCKFQREIVNRNPQQLDDFKENIKKIAKFLEVCKLHNSWFKNENSCHKFRGCQYKELCLTSKGINIDEQIADTLYVKHDPKAYLSR